MANLTAENTFCASVTKKAGQSVAFSVSGTFVGTITYQRRRPGSATWQDIQSTTVPEELDAVSASDFEWQAGFKTGNYTSGTAVVNAY